MRKEERMNDTETTESAPEAPPEVTCTGGARLRLRATTEQAVTETENQE